jgi:hypothetical protein
MSSRPGAAQQRGEEVDARPASEPGGAARGRPGANGNRPARSAAGSGASGRRRAATTLDLTARRGRRGAASQPVEVRRVRRILRRVDTWSVFRFSAVLYLCGLLIFMAAVVGLWILASGAGAIPSIENFITQLFALKKFHFKAVQLFLATFAIGIVWVFAATLFTVVSAVLYNLISDVVGGIELIVLEEEPLEVVG